MITWTRSKVPTHLFSLPSYASFATEWNQLASRQHLEVAVHTDGVTFFSQWPLQHFFDNAQKLADEVRAYFADEELW